MIKSSKKAEAEYIQELLRRGSNKFFVTDYAIKNLDDLDQPIAVDYSFKVEDYYRNIRDKIYFNMNLDKAIASKLIEEDRIQPRTFRFKTLNNCTSTLVLPKDYSVSRLPENSTFENEVFSFNIEYIQQENQLIQNRNFTIKTIQIEPDQFDLWNEALKQLSEAFRDIVILEKTGA